MGRRLYAWREHRRLTQTQLGEMVGTTHSVISLLENGERKLSPEWLHRLAVALDVTPGTLVDSDPDQDASEVVNLYYQIPEPQRSVARDVLRAFHHQTPNLDDPE